jgi:hypothetical protein
MKQDSLLTVAYHLSKALLQIHLKMEVDNIPPVAEKDGQGWNYYKVRLQAGDHRIVK